MGGQTVNGTAGMPRSGPLLIQKSVASGVRLSMQALVTTAGDAFLPGLIGFY